MQTDRIKNQCLFEEIKEVDEDNHFPSGVYSEEN